MNRIRRFAQWSLALSGIALLAIQLVPVGRTNPAVETEMPAPAEVRAILRRACYDCHSNETGWPWYSRVAPVSWLVAYDVNHAREEMNFSTWNRYSAERQNKLIGECWEEVEDGEMPPGIYVPMHPGARLTEEDRTVLRAWSRSAPRGPQSGNDE